MDNIVTKKERLMIASRFASSALATAILTANEDVPTDTGISKSALAFADKLIKLAECEIEHEPTPEEKEEIRQQFIKIFKYAPAPTSLY